MKKWFLLMTLGLLAASACVKDPISAEQEVTNVSRPSFTATTEDRGDFTFVSGCGTEAVTGPYRAWYPAALYNGGTPALPVKQNYTTGNIAESPMYAAGNSASLAFKNLGGIIRLNLTTENSGILV